MKEVAIVNWDLNNGYVPEKLFYCRSVDDRRLYIAHFPRGFMSLPNADLIIDRLMFYAKLSQCLEKKCGSILNM